MSGRVLIVMRTKNRPLLLARALDSVLAQSYGDWRLVVVNDGGDAGPVDALLGVRRDAIAGRSRVIHNPASVGMEAASNIALRSEQADYAVIHDDDDSWDPAFLATTVTTLAALPDRWGGVVTRSRLIRERITADSVVEMEALEFNASLAQITIGDLAAVNQFPPISFLYRTAVLAKSGFYREDLPVLGDWEFNLRLIQQFDIRVIPAFLANWHHRVSDTPVTGYENSFQAISHDQFAAMLRNDAMRADLATGRFGLGELMSRNSAMLEDLRQRLRSSEVQTSQHLVLLQQQEAALAAGAERERLQAQHVTNLEVARQQQENSIATLRQSELHLHNAATQLRAENTELSKQIGNFAEKLSELRQDSLAREQELRISHTAQQRLHGELRSAQHTQQVLAQQLAASQAETAWERQRIAALQGSTSWRLTAPFRSVSRVLAGIFRWVGPGSWRWRRHRMTAKPLHDVEAMAGGYVATGIDPQLELVGSRRLPRGFVLASFQGANADGAHLQPFLYADGGAGFLPTPIPLVGGERVLRFLPPSSRLRIDPLEGEGNFHLDSVTLIEVGRGSLLLLRLLEAARLLIHEPRFFRRRARRLFAGLGKGNGVLRTALIDPTSLDEPYETWVRRYDRLKPADRQRIREHIEQLTARPTISVLMPVYNPPIKWLKRAIRSVREQIYPHWELCIADDASTDPAVRKVLSDASRADQRIKVVYRGINGHISAASNSALETATGEYIALLDNDDELSEHALYHMAVEIADHPGADLFYSDEDKLDADGIRYHPYFKPEWNPDLMLSQNTVGHLAVYRRSAMLAVGGFRVGFEGAQDHDLALRVSERAAPDGIRHVPYILYHWRSIEGSTARAGSEKGYAWAAGKKAVEEALNRRALAATVGEAAGGIFYRLHYALPKTPPRVSLLIPTRDRVDLLRNCVRTILERTDYPDIEIVIIDNDSEQPETLDYFREVSADKRVKILKVSGPFNFSRLNNLAARQATGQVIGLVNNDIEVSDGGWLREMVSHALRPQVGAVGAKLLYGDGRVQHGGVILGIGGIAGHFHRFADRADYGYFGRASVAQNLSAVTAACLLLRRSVFEEVGGLDEENLAVAFNDVDFCLRIRERGYRLVWTPFAELFHLESATRGSDETEARRPHFRREMLYMMKRWGAALRADPAYNPNLALDHEYPRLAFPPRTVRPWEHARIAEPAGAAAPLARSA